MKVISRPNFFQILRKSTGRPLGARFKGASLVYTLTITVLVAMALGSLVLLHGYSRIETDRAYHKELAADNAGSGLEKVLYGQGPFFGEFHESLFGSELDSFHVRSFCWGLYGVLHSEGVHGRARHESSVLFGVQPSGVFGSNLFVTDRNKPVMLVGNTRLKGHIQISEAGFRRGQVGMKGYSRARLYEGILESSSGKDIRGEYAHLGETRKIIGDVWNSRYPQCPYPGPGTRISAGWKDAAVVVGGGGLVTLKDVSLSGKVIVIAQEIFVPATAELENVLLFAQRIYFEQGFAGKVQAFATDNLKAGEDCHFAYPSVLMVCNGDNRGQLTLGQRSVVEGMVVQDGTIVEDRNSNDGHTLLDSASRVYGMVLVQHNLELRGTVSGHVLTGNFILSASGGYYENYLMDVVVTCDSLGENYAMGILQQYPSEFLVIGRLK